MNWDDLRYFIAVATGGGLSAASRSLGASQATVSRRIAALEAALGVRLFERRKTGYLLSSAGEALLGRAQRIEADFVALAGLAGAAGPGAAGDVRVTAPEFIGAGLLVGEIAALRARHPGLRIELLTGSPSAGLSRHETDIALRFEKPLRGGFDAVERFPVGFAVYAAARYVAACGRPRSLDDFTGHRLIDFDESQGHVAPVRWLRDGAKHAEIAFRSNSVRDRLAAAQGGLGIALLPALLGDRDDGLVTLFPVAEIGRLDMWLLVNGNVGHQARVIAARDFVGDALRANGGVLAGIG